MDDFVELVRHDPKVWAVYATQNTSGITVWTYVDSEDRTDRSPVYSAEWQLMTHFPDVAFDFNVLLAPAGSEEFDAGTYDYLFIR